VLFWVYIDHDQNTGAPQRYVFDAISRDALAAALKVFENRFTSSRKPPPPWGRCRVCTGGHTFNVIKVADRFRIPAGKIIKLKEVT
jgi:hypothetical protein